MVGRQSLVIRIIGHRALVLLGALDWKEWRAGLDLCRYNLSMAHVKSYRELEVYRITSDAANRIFHITKDFPKEEMYSLTDQVRRSSRSVGAQIAEGWGKRRYEKHFIKKLTDADAEQLETQHWIETARQCQYISQENSLALLRKYASIGKMLNSMISKAHLFCHNKKESSNLTPHTNH